MNPIENLKEIVKDDGRFERVGLAENNNVVSFNVVGGEPFIASNSLGQTWPQRNYYYLFSTGNKCGVHSFLEPLMPKFNVLEEDFKKLPVDIQLRISRGQVFKTELEVDEALDFVFNLEFHKVESIEDINKY